MYTNDRKELFKNKNKNQDKRRSDVSERRIKCRTEVSADFISEKT